MNFFIALIPPLTSLAAIFLPGVFIARWGSEIPSIIRQLARAILWSVTINSFLSMVLSALALPPALSVLISLLLAVLFLPKHRRYLHRHLVQRLLVSTLLFLLLFFIFSLPYLFFHDGLPTGDSQKSIYWAAYILEHHRWPNYSIAASQLNRDPVDFYTPALHALTAAIMQPSRPAVYPLLSYTAVGFFAIALSLATVIIAMAITSLIAAKRHLALALFFTPVVLLTHLRFLRYLREPGYHLQNIAGELLLFGALFLLLSLLHQPSRSDFFLFLLVAITLLLTHQFSSFIAVLALTPPVLSLLWVFWPRLKSSAHLRRSSSLSAGLLLGFIALFMLLGLFKKIPHLVSRDPHLLSLTPSLADYFTLLGAVWLLVSLAGLILIYYLDRRRVATAFVFSTLILLILSQAPRFGLDIPPVRALFYTVVPLSVSAAIFLARVVLHLFQRRSFWLSSLAIIFLLVVFIPTITAVSRAFDLSHTVRTNSTLLPAHWPLITFLQTQTDDAAVLYDDYNRRSSSWFIMAKHPIFSRLSSELKVQMAEARQSPVRADMYLKQLDFEKIYMLGSRPEITSLLTKYNIHWLLGVNNSSAPAFSSNPALHSVLTGSDLTLFAPAIPAADVSFASSDYATWLLRPTTLVNDLGDPEDDFLHLPASLRSTRLSSPQSRDGVTYRLTTAPLIPLYFNVNDYAAVLWDQDGDGFADNPIQLSISTLDGQGEFTVLYGANGSLTVPANGTPATVPPRSFNLIANPYLVFVIDNPHQQPISLDLIALGLSRTP